MERLVPASGLQANGHFIPEGTVVSIAPLVVHQDTEVFGNDADIYRPQRWLEGTPSALQRMDHNFMGVSLLRLIIHLICLRNILRLIYRSKLIERSSAREIVHVSAVNLVCCICVCLLLEY